MRKRFWIESAAAVACGALTVVTLFWRDWIEVTGWDPDDRSGAVEWLVVAVLAVISLVSAVLARVEWRRGLAMT